MKKRIKDKWAKIAWEKTDCIHHYVGPRFLVTDDPYPIYNAEDYCKIGLFDITWSSPEETYPCENCKHFCMSAKKVREFRKLDKKIYRETKFYNMLERKAKQLGLTYDEYMKKYYNVTDYDFDEFDIIFK